MTTLLISWYVVGVVLFVWTCYRIGAPTTRADVLSILLAALVCGLLGPTLITSLITYWNTGSARSKARQS